MSTWLIPTNRQKSHVLGNTMVLSEGATSLIISQCGRSSSGYQTLGLFFIRMWLPSTEHVNTRANRSSFAQLMQ